MQNVLKLFLCVILTGGGRMKAFAVGAGYWIGNAYSDATGEWFTGPDGWDDEYYEATED